MFLSAFSIYGYVFLGLLVFSMLLCYRDILDMYLGAYTLLCGSICWVCILVCRMLFSIVLCYICILVYRMSLCSSDLQIFMFTCTCWLSYSGVPQGLYVVMQDSLRTLDLGFLACSSYACGSRVGSSVQVAISHLVTYGYALCGGQMVARQCTM